MITIYGKPTCGFCTKAKNFATDRLLEFEYKDVQNAQFLEELKEKLPNVSSIPQIWINGSHIGGYKEFATYVEETGYTGTGDSL